MNRRCTALLCAALSCAVANAASASQDPPTKAQPSSDRPHDFDAYQGQWIAHHRRLARRLAGSGEWVEFDGTFHLRLLLEGRAAVDDSFFGEPGDPHRGVGLMAYDGARRKWLIWGLDGRNPLADLDPPLEGSFEHGVGTFFGNDTWQGKPVRVRVIWSVTTAATARWEQAFSADGGHTWETNWVTEFRKAPAAADPGAPRASPDPSGAGAFDVRFGSWNVHHRRLKERLAGSHEWIEFDGTQRCWPLLGGAGNVDENLFHMPAGDYRGVSLRAYDPRTRRWAIWWLDGRNPSGPLDPPVKGVFEHGVGAFYSADTLRGRPIRVRYLWSAMTPESAHWEQAFSPDEGKTWETNWVTDFRRAP